jgi:NADH-quinone oxidoreductase subunit J
LELTLFYIAAAVSLVATMLVITRTNASHALIYLIISLLAIAVVFYLLGAPFAAALEIVIYAGAIMVLFLFVVMILNLGQSTVERERQWTRPTIWIGPAILSSILFFELIYGISTRHVVSPAIVVTPREVGIELFGPYLLAVELASILLLAALVGAFHLGRRYMRARREEVDT